MRRFTLLLLAALAFTSAHSQVLKCTNPKTGAVTFSDAPCDSGERGVVVQQRRSAAEIEADNQRAAEANERKYRQRMAEQGRQRQPSPMEEPMRQPAAQDKSQSYACQRAMRDHDVISSSITGTAEQRRNRINASTSGMNAACGLSTEMIQPPPRVVAPLPREMHRPPPPLPETGFTHCDGGFCYGNQGGVYHRNGPDHMTGPNGASCNRSGSNWLCN